MPTYSFNVKKGKFLLSVTTTDYEFVAQQFELWVRSASKYAKEMKAKQCKTIVNQQIQAEEEVTQKNIDNQLAKFPQAELPKIDESLIGKKEKKQVESAKNIDILYSPVRNNVEPEVEQNISNQVLATQTFNEKNQEGGVFDNILENSMKNPQTELSFRPNPTIKKDNAFLNFITGKKIEKKIDYLLLTAYYFAQYEQKPRFTLKQLNSKLMQNIAVIIDHSVLQEAINRDYLECLPDLTGLVGASEYRLTAYGEKVLLDD